MLDDYTHVISPPRSRLILLDRHHLNFDSGNCYICDLPSPLPAGDHNATSFRSEARLFENDIELGPRNTQHADIRRLGRGRFSHWMHQLYFSSSDNSSPIENGCTYHLLIPPSMFAADNTTYVPSLEGIEFGKMALMERFALARNVYRKVWGNTPLPDHGRHIDTDQNFARGTGLDFGTRLALAAEADATIGPSCIFTLAAALSGRPVTLLDSGRDVLDVAPDIRNVRTVPALDAADLDREIKSLIERSDAEELKLTQTTQEAMMPC